MKRLELSNQRAEDLRILSALIDCGELEHEELVAFTNMRHWLTESGQVKLTPKQRAWAAAAYKKQELDRDEAGANLASSGAVEVTEAERQALSDWTKALGPKVLRPPPSVRRR